MSFIVNRLRSGSTAGENGFAPAVNVENGAGGFSNGPRSSSRSPPTAGPGGRFRSKSPNSRARSTVRTSSFPSTPPAFPTPFHPFKLHPHSNKNQVNALKFIDRIDSLLFLGHTGQTVLAAIPACMANTEAQGWYNRVMNSDIRRKSTIEEFRELLIIDHIWSVEQSRIQARYQSQTAANANRKDPYLDSAEFKLHLAYIRDIVRLEEGQSKDEKKISQLEADKAQLLERENTLQMAVADLQNETVSRNGGQPVPVLQRTNDILTNMKQLDDSKLKVSMLEQEKKALTEKIASLQMKVDDSDSTNIHVSNIRLQLQNSNTKNAELQNIILQLEQSNSSLQQRLLAAHSAPPSQSPPPSTNAADNKELQQLKKQNQQILNDLHQKEIRVHDLEAQVRSYSFLQAQHNEQQRNDVQPLLGLQAPAQQAAVDRTAITNLEEIIKQKDFTITNLHSNLNKLTDESINRIHRVYQVEQLLLDSQLVTRNKDAQIFTLERRLSNLGHQKDCNCSNCALNHPNGAQLNNGTQTPMTRIGSPDVKRTTSPEFRPAPRVMSISSASELSGPTISSRTGTPFQQNATRTPPRFLDIKFKYAELYPSFIPPNIAPRVAQLLQNGLTILHPSHEFTKLWENIAQGLLETLGGDGASLGELTRHMKLCFREREGETLNGLVVATVWGEVWSSVTGLDVVCDF
ncbi:hypothetical protein TWF106_000478 [Orbilia oligospora]|uniref:Uncharacterized protein n=1 Tax=Orbilia oligospora TaxID=2813651 RepID=A0A6G1M7X7_ORBOL|nr:hypothetical protein TWF788_001746 [Orbilia oligospora]KAF3207224.1 hypothetical protein TWF106_000478 [Orbilia oligospora]KAF3212725.1 hypothetical protein TWF679_005612 [Orbilia oligospora]KAF3246369.1 hypothetical protein TWF192_006883 [Orbilia oligospora]